MATNQDLSLTLRKQPVRKAAATKTAKAETKARPTREKKAHPEHGPEIEEGEGVEELAPANPGAKTRGRSKKATVMVAPELEDDESAKPKIATKATKAGTVRGKKGAPPSEETETDLQPEQRKQARSTKAGTLRGRRATASIEETTEERRPTRAAKAGTLRGKKASAAVEEAPPLPAPTESKPSRQTRGAADKPQPLSPKKVTQVSKPSTRPTKNAAQKPTMKPAAKAPTRGRGATKRRAVSDENADMPDVTGPREEDDEDDEVIILSSAPVTHTPLHKPANERDHVVESEASMSSRPTTPGESPAHSFVGEADEKDDCQDDTQPVIESAHEGDGESDDELCGPKTPMRRASPGAQARYLASVERTVRRYGDQGRIQTPARNYAVLGSQRVTPQTHKPYCKPAASPSEVRPMTVARGTGKALVFRDLREGAPSLPEKQVAVEDEDQSFMPDENIIPEDDDVHALATPSATAPSQLQSLPESAASIVEVGDDVSSVAGTELDLALDLDETLIVNEDEDSLNALPVEPAASFETEDTVIITHHEQGAEDGTMLDDRDESDNSVVISHDAASPTPETMIWENLQQDETIAVNFDEHLASARSLPQPEATERLSIIPSIPSPQAAEKDVATGADMETDDEQQVGETDAQASHHEIVIAEPDATVNLNDFIDVAALSRPSFSLEIDRPESSCQAVGPVVSDEDSAQEAKADLGDQAKDDDEDEIMTGIKIPQEVDSGAEKDEVVSEENKHQGMMSANDDHVSEQFGDEAEIERDVREEGLRAYKDQGPVEIGAVQESNFPHYALPTFAFDARRKSLPAFGYGSPVKTATRPNTSDGASIPRIANPFAQTWWARSGAGSTTATLIKSRPSTAHATPSVGRTGTPAEQARASAAATPLATPKERYPGLRPRQNYEEHAKTVVAPARFQRLSEQPGKRRETFHKAVSGPAKMKTVETPAISAAETPAKTPVATPQERYPRLRPREDYVEHAKTVAAPRFQTPTKLSVKKQRPATTQKPGELRKAALKAYASRDSNTPVKTPLKAPATTPAQVPMTPHPAAPLSGVAALVEVFTLEGASASAPFIALLHRLGAKTTRAWSDRVTHIVFKDGSPTTLQRVRLHNKDVDEVGKGARILCVNSRWVNDCDTEGMRMDESDEAYVVDVAEVPRGGKRRRKSMEPSALMNIGGNVVRDGSRKSSLGRSSLSVHRSPLKLDSPAKKMETPEAVATNVAPEVATPKATDVTLVDKENSPDGISSPATPAWIAAPDQLEQQTAPMNRIRKLELQGGMNSKNRRLTFWNGDPSML